MENVEKIKIYRVLKDHLAIGHVHTGSYHPDDLYAYLGYTPFYGKIDHGFANNIGYNQCEEGKYFFLFPVIKNGGIKAAAKPSNICLRIEGDSAHL